MSDITRSVPYQSPTPVTLNSNGRAKAIETVYDIFGYSSDPPLVLIAGLGVQMTGWDEKFCAQLAGCGYRVIRFDNRDSGLATSFEEAGVPDLIRLVQMRLAGEVPQVPLPYTIYDMVGDTIALFDALELDRPHIVGASLGGIIAQLLTIEHQDRVKTLTAIMTTTGSSDLPVAKPEAISVFLRPPSKDRAEYIENALSGWQLFYGSGYLLDLEEARLRAGRLYDRAYSPDGAARQMAAAVALESLKPSLGAVTVPTLVIHGDEDPLFPIECGRDIAVSVSNAKMLVMEGVGHALPPTIWPQITAAIANHANDQKPGF
jgi:pimeloyl-ACP methyl ester carboxylesterase